MTIWTFLIFDPKKSIISLNVPPLSTPSKPDKMVFGKCGGVLVSAPKLGLDQEWQRYVLTAIEEIRERSMSAILERMQRSESAAA